MDGIKEAAQGLEPPFCSQAAPGTMRESKHLSYSGRHEGSATLAKAGVKKLEVCF